MAIVITILEQTTVQINPSLAVIQAKLAITNGGAAYYLIRGGIPLNTADVPAFLNAEAAALWADALARGVVLTAQQLWVMSLSALQLYFGSIIKSLYDDVDNGGVTIDQLLTNAAAIIATNSTQAAKFNAYRTRLGISGTIASLTAAQKGQLLVLGLEWAAAGLAVANTRTNGS